MSTSLPSQLPTEPKEDVAIKTLMEAGQVDVVGVDVVQGEDTSKHDRVELEHLGYTPQLQRRRGFAHILGMLVSLLAVPFATGSTLYNAIIGGGPATMLWGAVLVNLIYWCIAYALGELVSRYPTSAGLYYWTYKLAPPRFRVVCSYVVGWMVVVSTLMAALPTAFGFATFVVGTVNIVKPDWSPDQWVYVLMTWAVLVSVAMPILFAPKLLPKFDIFNSIFVGAFQVVFFIVVFARAKAGYRSASYAFFHFDPSFSGWNAGWTFFLGLLPSAFTVGGVGLVTGMAEEIVQPEKNLPKAMTWCVPIALLLEWMLLLPICFTMPDPEDLINAPNGVILPYFLKVVIGNDAGAIVLMICILIQIYFCCLDGTQAASRLIWAFARDQAIPGSKLWARVSSDGNIHYAIILAVVIQGAVVLIDLGSTSAYNTFVSVPIVGFTLAYIIPIVCNLIQGRKATSEIEFGARFRWLGFINSWVTIVWTLFAMVLFCVPTTLPTTAADMNYASVVLVGFIVLFSLWFMVYARKVYNGPPEGEMEHE